MICVPRDKGEVTIKGESTSVKGRIIKKVSITKDKITISIIAFVFKLVLMLRIKHDKR